MSLYYYGNIPRLCYWWSNPNDAATIIGMILPFIWIIAWYIEKEKFGPLLKNLFLIVECGALLLLILTYSRWAILACICSIFAFDLVAEKNGGSGTEQPRVPFFSAQRDLQFWLARLRLCCASVAILLRTLKNAYLRTTILLIGLLVTNACGRFSIAVQGDKSVLNRFTLWTGGTKMVFSNPILGWGNGSAGMNYDNWYQDLSSQIVHGSMVNSYLNIAIEWGLPALCIILFLILTCLVLYIRISFFIFYKNRALLAGGGSIILYFVLVNFCYSTIYNIVPLMVLALAILNLGVFYWNFKKRIKFTRISILTFSISLFCTIIIYLVGLFFSVKESIQVTYQNAGDILLCKLGAPQKPIALTIVPDYRNLGSCYGARIRKLFFDKVDYFNAVQIIEPTSNLYNCAGEKVIVLGARIGDWGDRAPRNKQNIIFACPTAPPTVPIKITLLFLPKIDRWHVVERWKIWAQKNKCRIVFLDGDGTLTQETFNKIADYCIES